MKLKFKKISLITFFTIMLCSCSKIDFNVEDKISAPLYNQLNIYGTWKIEKCVSYGNKEINTEISNKYLDKLALFSGEISTVAEQVCSKPEYKARNVTASDYFLDKYKLNPSILGIRSERVEVITITSTNQPFYEFIQVDDSNLMVYIEGYFLYMGKVRDSIDRETINKEEEYFSETAKGNSIKDETLLRSGVLLGIRSSDNSYRTLWIYSRNKAILEIAQKQQLFIPRMKGFWEVGIMQEEMGNSIYVKELNEYVVEETTKLSDIASIDKHQRKILFAGNDYIGTEVDSMLRVIPIDNVALERGIYISDVVKENVQSALKLSRDALVTSLDKDKAQSLKEDIEENNFTLERRNGHWIMKGRLSYKEPEGDRRYEDFAINLMVPSKLISYDELYIPWNNIKAKNPATVDAFVSPNKDIALLLTNETLYIYSIDKGRISDQPIQKVMLKEGEVVIMAEWAIGEYAEKWGRVVQQRFKEINNK